jgi:hypothetical protein
MITVSSNVHKLLARDEGSALHQVLKKTVPAQLLDTIGNDNTVQLKLAIYAYTLHMIDFVTLKKTAIGCGLTGPLSHDIRLGALSLYESNLGLKQLTLCCLSMKERGIKYNVGRMLSKSGMAPDNGIILENLGKIRFSNRNLLRAVKDWPLMMPNDVRDNCEETMSKLDEWTRKFVGRKLSFVVKYNGTNHTDLRNDLYRAGVEAYYRLTPMVVPAHRENSVKRAIHNEGMDIINHFTSKKRAGISQTNPGEYITKISSLYTKENKEYLNRQIDLDWDIDYLQVEQKVAIQHYVGSSVARSSVVNKLLCDETHETDFIEYVHNQLDLKEPQSLEQIHATKTKTYLSLIAQYHDIPVLTVKRMAWQVLQILQGYDINVVTA